MEKPIVYFAGAIRGDRSMADIMRGAVRYIIDQGIPVLSEHIMYDSPNDVLATSLGKTYAELTAEDIERQDITWVGEATHVIAEISCASTGTGREVEYARNKHLFGKKPAQILCVYHRDKEHSSSAMIRGMRPEQYPNVLVRSYGDLAELKQLIDDFLQIAKTRI